MQFTGKGVEMSVDVAQQTDAWLMDAAREIGAAAVDRGLEISFASTCAEESGSEPELEVRQTLWGKLDTAHRAHFSVINALDNGQDENAYAEVSSETFDAEFESWLTEDKLSYITKQAKVGRNFHVVATPNVLITAATFKNLAKTFSLEQSIDPIFHWEVANKYSPGMVSGTNPKNGNKIHFNVVFEDPDAGLFGTVEQNNASFAKRKAEYQFLEAPSLFKSLAYCFTLREARGAGPLNGVRVADITETHNYTLRPKPDSSGKMWVPNLTVGDAGYLLVSKTHIQSKSRARMLIG